MAYEQKQNSGTIAKNTRKSADNHPDITGSINVAGVDYWINGWLKKNSRDGSSFYSLSVKPKEQRREQKPARQQSYAEESGGSYGRQPADLGEDEILF
jgi:hypothetical protein